MCGAVGGGEVKTQTKERHTQELMFNRCVAIKIAFIKYLVGKFQDAEVIYKRNLNEDSARDVKIETKGYQVTTAESSCIATVFMSKIKKFLQ